VKNFLKFNALLLAVSAAHAGAMGPSTCQDCVVPFVSAEAAYNWLGVGSVTINNIQGVETYKKWGGRVGAGITRSYRENFSFTGELGYGYYGKTNISFADGANVGQFSVDGLDLLVGAQYALSGFDALRGLDVFFKAGAMVENRRSKGSINLGVLVNGNYISGSQNGNTNQSQVLPELKVGGLYHVWDNFLVSLSYMKVFGSTVGSTSSQSATVSPASYTSNTSVHYQNPGINSIMFGLQYNFA